MIHLINSLTFILNSNLIAYHNYKVEVFDVLNTDTHTQNKLMKQTSFHLTEDIHITTEQGNAFYFRLIHFSHICFTNNNIPNIEYLLLVQIRNGR